MHFVLKMSDMTGHYITATKCTSDIREVFGENDNNRELTTAAPPINDTGEK